MSRYLSAADVAEEIGESVEQVRRRCKSGQIAATKLGDKWRIHPDAVDAFMRPNNVVTTPRPSRLSARQKRRRAS